MASNQTPVYGLNQWSLEDGIIMAEFNEDNQKTEQALVNANASITALQQEAAILRADCTSLGSTISSVRTELKKDDASLAQKINSARAAIPHVVTGTYVGTGTCGPHAPCTLTLTFQPKLLIVSPEPTAPTGNTTNYLSGITSFAPMIAIHGAARAQTSYDSNLYGGDYEVDSVNLSWDGTSVSWWFARPTFEEINYGEVYSQYQMNHKNVTYHYFAIGEGRAIHPNCKPGPRPLREV